MVQITDENSENPPQEYAAPSDSTAVSADVSATEPSAELPSPTSDISARLPPHLQDLTERARTYVEAASSANTRRAYASDWKHFTAWCRRQNLSPLPPDPEVVGLYITACASGTAERGLKANTVSTIERRLAAIGWNCVQRGMPLDRKNRAIATVMAGIRNKHAAPPREKEAILPEDLIAMLETLDSGTLRGLRDRAMLLIGFAGGLRRSEITGLDLGRDQTEDGRGSSDATCPVTAIETWIKFVKIAKGPLFRRVTGQGKDVGPDRLNDQEVARGQRFASHSLRAGLASSAEVDERYVQKQLGHASAEMTRRYQRRRDRFRVNLTKASGL